jgi:hypothetical protein
MAAHNGVLCVEHHERICADVSLVNGGKATFGVHILCAAVYGRGLPKA